MLTEDEARARLCPFKLCLPVPAQGKLFDKKNADRFCEGDRCMAWNQDGGYCRMIEGKREGSGEREDSGEDDF